MRVGARQILPGIGLALVAAFLGCSASSPPKNGVAVKVLQGQEVVVVAPNSLGLPIVWDVLSHEWSSQTGATARFDTFDAGAVDFKTALPDPSSGGNLVFFPLKKLNEIDARLSALPVANEELTRDIFKGLRERVLTRERKLIASPFSAPVLVCYYRQDLLRAVKRRPPETWDDYHQLVESLEKWAPGLAAVEPLSPEFRATTFFARSLAFCKHPENFSVWFDVDTGKPSLMTPGFERALEVAWKTWDKLPAETANYTPADCRRLILTGKAAITLSFEPSEAELTARTLTAEAPKLERADGIEVGVCRIPGSRSVFNRNSKKWDTVPDKGVHAPALCGFAGLAAGIILPPNAPEHSAAMNLLLSLNSPSVFNEAFATLPKSPCRESQLALASTWYGPDLSSEEASNYCDVVAGCLRDTQLVFELPMIDADEFRRAASDSLDRLLRRETDPKQTLAQMQKSFEAIVDRLGSDVIRDSHRKGLGLSSLSRK